MNSLTPDANLSANLGATSGVAASMDVQRVVNEQGVAGIAGGGGGGGNFAALSALQARPDAPGSSGPMIARTVSLSIVVKDFAASRAALETILARSHGYSAQMTVSTPDNFGRSLQASLRVPAPGMAAAVEEMKTLGHVQSESQSGEEVTQQHADLAQRLKTARDTEERFRALMQQRTGNVSDLLEVEEGIARVRGEIESMEAQQQALEHRVEFATIDLQLTEEYKERLDASSGFFSTRVHNAFVAGYRNAAGAVVGLLLFAIEYGPAILIWVVILGLPVFLVWRRYRRVRSRV
jgi:hypothetical protein